MTTAHTTGVWMDAAAATIVRWGPEGLETQKHLDPEVPTRHHASGPDGEHWALNEGNRNEHLRVFFDRLAALLPEADDLLLLGDGVVVEQFANHLAGHRSGHKSAGRVVIERCHPMTENQLVARLRSFAGAAPKRGFHE